MSVSGADGSAWFSKTCFDDSTVAAMKIIKEKDIEVIRISAEEQKRWAAVAKPIHEKYIGDLEAKGLPAREVYNEAVRLLDKYNK